MTLKTAEKCASTNQLTSRSSQFLQFLCLLSHFFALKCQEFFFFFWGLTCVQILVQCSGVLQVRLLLSLSLNGIFSLSLFSQKNMPFWRVSCRADLEALSHALELDYL